mgnify:FL=1
MIKAEDLRIGDIVRCGEQVITIHAVYYKCIDDFVIGEETVCISCKDLEPIPLTFGILKKNGFDIIRRKEWYSKFIGSPDRYISKYISIECDDCNPIGWRVFIEYDKFTRYANLRQIHYVHELQHILWALGEDANLKV